MVPSFIQAACTIREAFTSLQYFPDLSVSFVLLEQLVGIKIGILVVKTNNQPDVNKIRLHVIHK